MTLVHKNLDPIFIPTKSVSKMRLNVLVIEVKLKDLKTRFINTYGVQESASIDEKSEFYSILEEEISITLDSGRLLCIELDANAKFGKEIINSDPHDISSNGRLLFSLVDRMNLVIVNSTMKCFGTITRMKNLKNKTEKSVLDYFLVCQNFYLMINSMIIDEDRNHVLTKYTKKNSSYYKKESDHNPLILDISISWNAKVIMDRSEIFNLRNTECQDKFFEYTNNSNVLTRCLINKDVKHGGKLWIKNLKYIILQNFKRIRVNRKRNKEDDEICNLIEQSRLGGDQERNLIEQEVAHKIFEKNEKQ